MINPNSGMWIFLRSIRNEQKELDKGPKSEAERLAKEREITYVPLDGNIAMIADGAGTGMLTLDLIMDEGGRAANFCEMGGMANARVTNESMEVVLAKENAKSIVDHPHWRPDQNG